MKRFTLFVLVALLFSSAAVMAAPFSDVPASHWAFDAINKLSDKGIVQGFPDGKFKGNKGLTRFDLAMVTAKMLAHVEQMFESGVGTNLVTKTDLQTLEKLTVEFADELALLGVKVTSLEDDMKVAKEDVSFLKKDVEGIKDYIAKGGLEKVKLGGDMLVRHTNITHKHDWALNNLNGSARAGNTDNSLTESMLCISFKANIDENISAFAYWAMLDYNTTNIGAGNAQSGLNGAFGIGGIGANKFSDNTIYQAYLEVKDMFRFGGDFVFGRNLYAHNHALLLNNYIDVIRYSKKIGDVNMTLQNIFDRHQGSYKDDANVDFRGVWNLDLNTTYRKHDFYLGLYGQDEPNLIAQGRMTPLFTAPAAAFLAGPVALGNTVAGQQTSDKRWDVEFGSKGPIGGNGHWSYDLGFVYTNYEADVLNTAADTAAFSAWISPEMNGWMGHGAVKWDSKKHWAAKLAGTFADDESVGAISINNDMRYFDAAETPYEDIARGNNYFNSGLVNMYDLKLQTEYRPNNTKHYFRLAGDFLGEMKDKVDNDMTRHLNGQGRVNQVGAIPADKSNTAYDSYNSLGIADPEATVVTFEYRYQLTDNTRIRVGYTTFDLLGDAQRKTAAVNKISAGRGLNNDYDYHMFWTEIYTVY